MEDSRLPFGNIGFGFDFTSVKPEPVGKPPPRLIAHCQAVDSNVRLVRLTVGCTSTHNHNRIVEVTLA